MTISRRNVIKIAATASLAAPFLSLGGVALAATNLRIGNSFPGQHPLNKRLKEAGDEISKRTDGEVRLKNFYDSQLGSDPDMMSQTRSGAIDGVCTSLLFLESLEPSANLAGLGYGYKDYDQVWKVWDGDVGNYVRDRLSRIGLYSLSKVYDNGFRQITNSVKPIATPDDLAGLKIRVPSARIQQSLFQHLGAAPTPVSIKETYSALKTHIVDGQENALTHIEVWKFYEVQKYVSLTNHMWDGLSVILNKVKVDAMPADQRKVLEDTLNEYALLQRKDMSELMAGLRGSLVSERGMQVNDVDMAPFRQKLVDTGFYDEWRKVIGEEPWSLYEKIVGAN
jgi:tripartite ATP-independent transporter DctP family solute receptor